MPLLVAKLTGQGTSTFLKRVTRIFGFACSGVLSLKFIPIISSLIFFMVIPLSKKIKGSSKVQITKLTKASPIGWVMMIHQSHYFSYAYIIPFILIKIYKIDPEVSGLLFCIGWLSYSFSQKIFGIKFLKRNFILGHIFASVTLGIIFFTFKISLFIFLLLWFLTGFGGGTVYCLRKLRPVSGIEKLNLDSWENIGHLIGTCVCICILCTQETPKFVFAVAASLAAITFLLFLLLQRKYKHAAHPQIC